MDCGDCHGDDCWNDSNLQYAVVMRNIIVHCDEGVVGIYIIR